MPEEKKSTKSEKLLKDCRKGSSVASKRNEELWQLFLNFFSGKKMSGSDGRE
jgi:hypothetical protein